jgi:hypothetical protein
MCEKCIELDRKIEHYRKLASSLYDRLTTKRIADLSVVRDFETRGGLI